MKPRRRISPRMLARACLRRAWADDADDVSRQLLEQASMCIENQHEEIKRLKSRLLSNAKCLEVVEAELASRRYPLLGGDDDAEAAL